MAMDPATPWRRLCDDEWLLCSVLAFLEPSGDDVHWLWLLALDDGLTSLRARLEQHAAVNVAHARRLAMARSLWPALRKLAWTVRHSRGHKLSRVDEIQGELAALGVAPHADRRAVLSTAVVVAHTPPESTRCPLCARDRSHRCPGGFERRTSPDKHVHFCNELGAWALYAAARDGLLESVVWLHYIVCYDQEKALELAGRNGHTRLVQWMLDHAHAKTITVDFRSHGEPAWACWRATPSSQHYVMTEQHGMDQMYDAYSCVFLAAKRGDIRALRELNDVPAFRKYFSIALPGYAVCSGRLEVLEFLYQQSPSMFTNSTALWGALRDGHLEIAQWLVAHGYGSVDDTWYVRPAMMNGRVDALEWMLSIAKDPQELQREMIYRATECTSQPTLEWLERKHGLKLTTATHAKEAIVRGETALAQWIVTRCTARHPLRNGPLLLETAISRRNLELVQWLIECFGVWSPNALKLACAGWSVDVLAYIYEASYAQLELPEPRANGTPFRRIETHRLAVLEWLLDRGFMSGLLESGALDAVLSIEHDYAVAHSRLEAHAAPLKPQAMCHLRGIICRIVADYDVEYVRRVQWLPLWAARHGSVATLKRLYEIDESNAFTRRRFDKLLSGPARESIVKWLLEKDPTLFSTLVVRWAVTHGKRGVLKWVLTSFVPVHGDKLGSDPFGLLRKCLRTAIWHASSRRSGGRFNDVLASIKTWTPLAHEPSLWRGIPSAGEQGSGE